MILTKKQSEDMYVAALPLMLWMEENCHPHCVTNVTKSDVELLEGIAREVIEGETNELDN
jgi:hypothetical protein